MTENHLDGRELRHRTPQERAALGKAARAEVPRSSQAEFAPGPKRPDPLEIIEKQSATRLPELVPVRYGRMSESPFRFYRGPRHHGVGPRGDAEDGFQDPTVR